MKNISSSILLLSVILILGACKKSKNDAVVTPTPPSGPFNYGRFSVEEINILDQSGVVANQYYSLSAIVYRDSIHNYYATGGSMSMNTDSLYSYTPGYESLNIMSLDTTGGYNWVFTDSGVAPDITYRQSSGAFPQYTGSIPDTIILINGLSLNIGSATTANADSVGVSFLKSFPHKVFSTANGVLTLSENELAASLYFSPLISGVQMIYVYIVKYEDVLLNGRHYKFTRTKIIEKFVYVL